MAPPSLYSESTELSADSVESHPAIPYLFAVSTYQVDQDGQDENTDAPAYTRRGRCRLHQLESAHDPLTATLQDEVEGAAVLDAKWCLAQAEEGAYGYGVLGIADATGHLALHRLDKSADRYSLAPLATWQMNDEHALCLSLDWSDRTQRGATDAKLILSQSNGTLAMVPSMHTPTPAGQETWHAHDYEAWIAAWDCWSGGTVAWSGTPVG